MRKYIMQAMEQMANGGKLFCSEADFQFSLGWELNKILPNAQLLFEKEVNVGYVDIIVIWNGKWYYIELKYHTSLCDTTSLGLPLHLKNQSAQDLLRYDYLYDIFRIQRIAANKKDNYGGGYAIVLTNDKLLYGIPRSSATNSLDALFRIHDRRGCPAHNSFPVPGKVIWNNAAKPSDHWTKSGNRCGVFTLSTINTDWEMYCNFNDLNNVPQDFRYLINEVFPSTSCRVSNDTFDH